jgi:hypothetical protein
MSQAQTFTFVCRHSKDKRTIHRITEPFTLEKVRAQLLKHDPPADAANRAMYVRQGPSFVQLLDDEDVATMAQVPRQPDNLAVLELLKASEAHSPVSSAISSSGSQRNSPSRSNLGASAAGTLTVPPEGRSLIGNGNGAGSSGSAGAADVSLRSDSSLDRTVPGVTAEQVIARGALISARREVIMEYLGNEVLVRDLAAIVADYVRPQIGQQSYAKVHSKESLTRLLEALQAGASELAKHASKKKPLGFASRIVDSASLH